MSITGELRKWWVRKFPVMDNELHKDFNAIADRIDAEHQRQLDVLYRDMSDSEWVRLPVDADGVPIRFGDKVTVPWSEKVYEVSGFSYTQQLSGGKRIIWVDVYSLEKMRNIPLCGANSCHHYHAPTVEDVLHEFICDHEEGVRDEVDLIAEYAAKLRLAGDAE